MRCANASCGHESRYLREGKVFLVDRPAQAPGAASHRERQLIWLCKSCCSTVVVETWRPPGSQLRHAVA
jgi:hypothetical protein